VYNLQNKKEETADTNTHLLIEEISKYARDNISKKLSIKDIAEHFNYSPNYIGHIFKEKTGTSFNNHVAKLRVEIAAKMLKVPQNHLWDISDALGYSDVTYFIKQFKEYYGITPKAYRNNEGLEVH
jgi:two-component system response regulator YesN